MRSRKFSCEKKAKIDFSNIKWWASYSWGTNLSIYSPYSQPYVPFTLRKIFRVYFALLYMGNIEFKIDSKMTPKLTPNMTPKMTPNSTPKKIPDSTPCFTTCQKRTIFKNKDVR